MVAVRVPVVDFKLLVGLGSREASAEDTSEVLHKALSTVGFVYLVNHGISEELVSSAIDSAVEADLLSLIYLLV